MTGSAPPSRVGVLGGTFDPVHNGHIAAALDARYALGLDTVVMVPAGAPWQKAETVQASAADRLAMVEAAVADVDGLGVSDVEVRRPGPSYTVDTLEELAAPDRELFLLLGTDTASNIHTWHRSDDLWDLATLVVFERSIDGARDSAVPPALVDRVATVDVARLDISSSGIRERLAGGRPVGGLLPPAVVRHIAERHLYTARNG